MLHRTTSTLWLIAIVAVAGLFAGCSGQARHTQLTITPQYGALSITLPTLPSTARGEVLVASGNAAGRVIPLGPGVRTTTIGGLNSDITYRIRWRAVQSTPGPWSTLVSVQPLAPPPPSGLVAVPGSGTCSITWLGGPAGTSYDVLEAIQGGKRSSITPGFVATTLVSTKLSAGDTWRYRVRSHTSQGTSDWSDAVTCQARAASSVPSTAPAAKRTP